MTKNRKGGTTSTSAAGQGTGSKRGSLPMLLLSSSAAPANRSIGSCPAAAKQRRLDFIAAAGEAVPERPPAAEPRTAHGSGGGVGVAAAGETVAWARRFQPTTAADLVVHKKKVEELQAWLETMKSRLGCPGGRCLLLTGPPGSGKTTAVQVLAAELGLQLMEWTPPAGASWAEHLHNREGGWQPQGVLPAYRSKLDEFEDFVGRSTLFPSLRLQSTAQCREGNGDKERGGLQVAEGGTKLLLVDDLPHAAGPEQRSRLAAALGRLAATSRFATVVVTTTGDRSGSAGQFASAALGNNHGLHKELLGSLTNAGVHIISFNPITVRNAAKALKTVAASMGVILDDESAGALAEASSGDLHNAIESLQLHMLGHRYLRSAAEPKSSSRGKGGQAKKRKAGAKAVGPSVALHSVGGGSGGMDSGLSLFHALGKILHNKRSADNAINSSSDNCGTEGITRFPPAGTHVLTGAEPLSPLPLAQSLRRLHSGVDPEATVARSQLETDTVLGFLQENLLDFIADDRIEDAAGCMEHLSCSSFMQGRRQYDRAVDPGADLGDISSSVGVRGTLWSNSQPQSRWQPLRAPALRAVRNAISHNQEQLGHVALQGSYALQLFSGSSTYLAAEVLPFLRSMHACGAHPGLLGRVMPRRWMYMHGGKERVQEFYPPAAAAAGGETRSGEDPGEYEWGEEEGIEDC